eukprot:36711_1
MIQSKNNGKLTPPVSILVYGSQGWIGKKVVTHLQTLQKQEKINCKLTLSSKRVENYKDIENEILSVNPTHIICTIGRTHGTTDDGTKVPNIDYLELPNKTRENVRDNLFAPMVLALLANKYDVHLTYLGTGCLYQHPIITKSKDGDEQYDTSKCWSESDVPNFHGSKYTVVKAYTDQLMNIMEYTKNVLNVRIRYPISDDFASKRNLITKLVGFNSVVNVTNSMSVLDELMPIMIDMVMEKRYGTINLVNKGSITHNEILTMYKEIIDGNHTWTNITSMELEKSFVKAPRSNNCLSITASHPFRNFFC